MSDYLSGKLLIALPILDGSCFERSLLYVFAHNSKGAMGIMVNKFIENFDISKIAQQFAIDLTKVKHNFRFCFGGPVSPEKGFILHSADYREPESMDFGNNLLLTSSNTIIQTLCYEGKPKNSVFAIGYTGWGERQLEREIELDAWLIVEPSYDLIFTSSPQNWQNAIAKLGFKFENYSSEIGHA